VTTRADRTALLDRFYESDVSQHVVRGRQVPILLGPLGGYVQNGYRAHELWYVARSARRPVGVVSFCSVAVRPAGNASSHSRLRKERSAEHVATKKLTLVLRKAG
jgi:hypothetical protein